MLWRAGETHTVGTLVVDGTSIHRPRRCKCIASARCSAALAGAGFIAAGRRAGVRCGSAEPVPAESDADVEDAVIQVTDVGHLARPDSASPTAATTSPATSPTSGTTPGRTRDNDADGGDAERDADADEAEVSAASISGAAALLAGAGGRRHGWRRRHRRRHQRRVGHTNDATVDNTIAAGAATAGNTVGGGVSQTQANTSTNTATSAAASAAADVGSARPVRPRLRPRRPSAATRDAEVEAVVVQAAVSDIRVSQGAVANSGGNTAVNHDGPGQRR